MMSISEYAIDVNKPVSEILNLCKKLNIPVLGEDDELDEDAITELDNTIAREEEMDLEYEEELIEKEEKKQEGANTASKQKKQIQVNNKVKVGKKELAKKKKEMYKNKEKLISNGPVVLENTVTYKEGMTIGDLAKALNVSPGELIKKLFTLGILATVNNRVDFENADLLVSEFGKELKREVIIDETKFEEFEINDKEEDSLEEIKEDELERLMSH